MSVREARADDAQTWARMRAALWPEATFEELLAEAEANFVTEPPALVAFLCEDDAGNAVGMLELSLRPFADGCDSRPVPYVEGWYVVPEVRRRGWGRALVNAAFAWARARGYTEMASDALLDNQESERAHKALGFQEVERAIRFRADLT